MGGLSRSACLENLNTETETSIDLPFTTSSSSEESLPTLQQLQQPQKDGIDKEPVKHLNGHKPKELDLHLGQQQLPQGALTLILKGAVLVRLTLSY